MRQPAVSTDLNNTKMYPATAQGPRGCCCARAGCAGRCPRSPNDRVRTGSAGLSSGTSSSRTVPAAPGPAYQETPARSFRVLLPSVPPHSPHLPRPAPLAGIQARWQEMGSGGEGSGVDPSGDETGQENGSVRCICHCTELPRCCVHPRCAIFLSVINVALHPPLRRNASGPGEQQC